MANQSWYHSFFDVAPYNDSWTPSKNYLSLGFLPGYALQSRELLELQTTLLYQISTTNRTLFKHGQPRIDLEEESLNSSTSPISVNVGTHKFSISKNTQLFTNFSLVASGFEIPNGFWITIPPSNVEHSGIYTEQITAPEEEHYVGFDVEIKSVSTIEDDTLFDPVGTDFKNSGGPGATRYAYGITLNSTGGFLRTNQFKRKQSQFFVPIAQYKNGSYYWAFDESTAIIG